MKVKVFMAVDPVTINSVADMKEVKKCFATTHQAWPVLNLAGNLCGIIPKTMIVRLLEHKAFYKQEKVDPSKVVEQFTPMDSVFEQKLERIQPADQ